MEKKIRKDPRQRLGTSKKKSIVTISTRIPHDDYMRVVELCKNKNLTLSEYIRNTVVPEPDTQQYYL
jgi:hypothetical protein